MFITTDKPVVIESLLDIKNLILVFHLKTVIQVFIKSCMNWPELLVKSKLDKKELSKENIHHVSVFLYAIVKT